jgi:hypothetical protein
MNIFIVIVFCLVLALLSIALSENNPGLSKIFLATLILVGIWISMSVSLENKKEKFVKKIPVCFQEKIAFSTYENNLINCSDKFNMQFKPGDSIYVFKEQDTWMLGIKYSGGDLVYKINK